MTRGADVKFTESPKSDIGWWWCSPTPVYNTNIPPRGWGGTRQIGARSVGIRLLEPCVEGGGGGGEACGGVRTGPQRGIDLF